MTKPNYQTITKDSMKKYFLENNSWIIEVISGEYKWLKSDTKTFSPVTLLNAKLKKWIKTDFSFPVENNTALLVVSWSIKVNNDENVSENYFVLMDNLWENFEMETLTDDTIVFVMSWKPLNEPIYASWPFVMNNQEEVSQAYRDFHSWKFWEI